MGEWGGDGRRKREFPIYLGLIYSSAFSTDGELLRSAAYTANTTKTYDGKNVIITALQILAKQHATKKI